MSHLSLNVLLSLQMLSISLWMLSKVRKTSLGEKKKNHREVSYNALLMSAKNWCAVIPSGTKRCYFMTVFNSEIEPSRGRKHLSMNLQVSDIAVYGKYF